MAESNAGLDLSDPVFKKLSRKNGVINRMTKDQLVNTLQQLKLESRGNKEVLRKRLKNYYKKKELANNKNGNRPIVQDHDFLLVIDFEATCQQNNGPEFFHEIIEFPIILIDTKEKKVVDEFHSYVKPEFEPKLSQFCMTLTGIKQRQVDRAPMFPDVLSKVQIWMKKHELGTEGHSFALVTDGPWDMSRFMANQCHASRLPMPAWSLQWVNVRKLYANFYDCKRQKLCEMVDGLGLSFEGSLHSGIDDARNIARIVMRLLEDGAVVRVNECLVKVADEDGRPCYEVQNVTSEQAKKRLMHKKVVVHKVAAAQGSKVRDETGDINLTEDVKSAQVKSDGDGIEDAEVVMKNDDQGSKVKSQESEVKSQESEVKSDGEKTGDTKSRREKTTNTNVTENDNQGSDVAPQESKVKESEHIRRVSEATEETKEDCARNNGATTNDETSDLTTDSTQSRSETDKTLTDTDKNSPQVDTEAQRETTGSVTEPKEDDGARADSMVYHCTSLHEIQAALREMQKVAGEEEDGEWEVAVTRKTKKKQQRDSEIEELVTELKEFQSES